MIWHLNNTSIRNPGRYLEALRAYDEYGLIEGLFGKGNKDAQKTLYNLILDAGLIDSSKRDSDWNGRKWRLGFRELGLIHYKCLDGLEPGAISKSGRAILDASNDTELQDVYFRIIFNLETRKESETLCFRPVPLILNVIKLLKEAGEKDSINQIEFAVTLQDFREGMTPQDYFNEIVKFREEVKANKGNLKNFYNETFKKIYERNNRRPNIKTISKEYPDATFRLLKLSGIFRLEGSKLTLNPQYLNLLNTLCSDNKTYESESEYYRNLSNLPGVPIDKDIEVLKSIVTENTQKLNIASPNLEALGNEELRLLRINQEDQILKNKEENFAYEQRDKVEIITKWFDLLISNKGIEVDFEGEYIAFKKDERPQYLEWIVWRAFLAINNLSNKPYESRKFPLDSELKPTSHAPSKGPDLLMEFDKFNLVVEVTWTTSSRQVAAEGEPVIRHVAQITYESDKPTYCLFIAPKIDLNTYQYYIVNDVYFLDENIEQVANIIPISLEEFLKFFNKLPKANNDSINKIYSILEDCTSIKKDFRPIEWKEFIIKKFTA